MKDKKENKCTDTNIKKPDRVHFPPTKPSPSDIKLHEDNKRLIQWLQNLKKRWY